MALSDEELREEIRRLRDALIDIQETCHKRQLPLTDQIWRRAEAALQKGNGNG